MNESPRLGGVLLALFAALVAILLIFTGTRSSRQALVVYCAHDSVYSEQVLRQFEQQTGIPVSIRFDTEATKSLGLVNLLIREKDNPRCDVFWNNQVLGTIELAQQEVLQPYRGSGYARIPDRFKDPDGNWTGFASRLRVFIVNTDTLPATEKAIEESLEADLSRMAVAKPMYGTTLSHYTLLWHLWGGEQLKQWHTETRKRGLREVAGNANVMNLVASGVCDFGWTDTDDFFVAADDGSPVDMLPIRLEGSAICIPNSVAIIRGTDKLSEAQQLVDFLLSEENELALSRSRARQIPLGPVDETELTDDVRRLWRWSQSGHDLTQLGPSRRECLQWLESEYLQ